MSWSIFKWKCLLCHVNLQRMTFQALYEKNLIIRRWYVWVCLFCRSGGIFYSQILSNRVRGCSKSSVPFTVSFFPAMVLRWCSGKESPLLMQETQDIWVWTLGWEDLLEQEMATHSSILAREIPGQRSLVWATVHGITKNWTRLTYTYLLIQSLICAHGRFATPWTSA